MEQQIINGITLIVGIFVGYFLSRGDREAIKNFATSYSDLSVQLINHIRNNTNIESRINPNISNGKPQDEHIASKKLYEEMLEEIRQDPGIMGGVLEGR